MENQKCNLANIQKEFCEENKELFQLIFNYKFCANLKDTSLKELSRGIKCHSSRSINNNYNKCFADTSFWAILGSSVFDLTPLKHEQKKDFKAKLLSLHDILKIETLPLDFEFYMHSSKDIKCDELINDILDNINY